MSNAHVSPSTSPVIPARRTATRSYGTQARRSPSITFLAEAMLWGYRHPYAGDVYSIYRDSRSEDAAPKTIAEPNTLHRALTTARIDLGVLA